ncbi:OmpA family protein [Delftia tsuruhatensis]|uniref:Peptidoglycan-associated lipoprotein n=1 Tax=Delftia tsuruhatensis TaxID=180282 RepID=A0AAX3SRB9_9BURK|nr:OmpA family protein [Delftia tsuruhatensis]WFF82659.1 OmpA family protein [Delftia tsuruhatensis]
MSHTLRLCTIVLLAAGLAACGSTATTSTQRSEHHYAFGKAPAPAPASSGVAPVVATSQADQRGPANVAHIVYFDFDAYTIRSSDRAIVESHAQWLRSNPGRSVMLRGHTDRRGGIEYNLALGQKRSDAVRNSLQLLGVNPARVESVSYGKERLADEGTSEDAHQRNRRVEFDYR